MARFVYKIRGGVVAAIAVMGAIAGSDYLIAQVNATLPADNQLGQIHMFIGAMIMAPLAAYTMKWLDSLWDGKIKAGFEMLVNMFSAGIWGFVLVVIGFYPVAWLVNGLMNILSTAVNWLVETNLLPLTSILIEPAKVFFLNNAINHGVLTPLGTQQAAESGKSILFLLEANTRPRPRSASRVHHLRHRRCARFGAWGRCHPVRRRHPRGLLPLRADEARPDRRADRRRYDRRHDEHALRKPD